MHRGLPLLVPVSLLSTCDRALRIYYSGAEGFLYDSVEAFGGMQGMKGVPDKSMSTFFYRVIQAEQVVKPRAVDLEQPIHLQMKVEAVGGMEVIPGTVIADLLL